MVNAITSNTSENLQLNAGVVCTTFDISTKVYSGILGATNGGGTFTAVPTIRQVEADGLPQNTKGFTIIDDWVVTLTVTLIETTLQTIKFALGSADIAANKITVRHEIATADYQDLWWIGDKSDGTLIAIKLKNAINNSGFNLNIVNKGQGNFQLTAVANYDVADLSEAPFEVYIL